MISVLKTFPEKMNVPLTLETLETGSWINMTAPTRDEIDGVSRAVKCPTDFLAAALDPEEASRIEADDGCLLVVINVPKVEGNFRFDAIPMGIIITREHIVTVALEQNDVLPSSPASLNAFSTFKRTRFLFQVLFRTATK